MTATLTQPVSCDNTKPLKHPFAALDVGSSMTSLAHAKIPAAFLLAAAGAVELHIVFCQKNSIAILL
ncbi:MAG: hypothetical protein F6K16_31225 [Symploca sp. SIO2B6]|nr:hypothetical protein [Symploca sp. SIO2B6]